MIRSDGSVQRQFGVLFDAGSLGAWGDGALLDRFLAGRDDAAEAAFAALVERHGPMVLRACRATLGDEHAAHDAFQATFLILARKARTVRVRDTVGPWLYGVAWRVASRARAADHRRRRHERRAAEMAPRSFEAVPRDDAESALHEEVRKLPEGFRAAVVLCDLEGLTTDQAAERLGTPVGTVRSRLYRGRDRLRGRLLRRGIAPAAIGAVVASGSVSALTVPAALAEATVGLAVVGGWSGVVPARLAWLVGEGRHVMGVKSVAAMGLSLGLVAGVGGIAAQGVGNRPGARPGDGPAAAVAAADEPKRDVSDLDRLQGRWILVDQEIIGGSAPSGIPPEVVTIRRDRITLTRPGNETTWPFTIDASGDPKMLQILAEPEAAPHIKAYELNGRRLVLISDAADPYRKPAGLRSPGPERPLRRWDLVRDPATATTTALAEISRETPAEKELARAIQAAPRGSALPTVPPGGTAAGQLSDVERLKGTWTVVKVSSRGNEAVGDDMELATFRFGNGDIQIDLAEGIREDARFRPIPGSSPPALRVKANRRSDHWLYAFEGDRLKLAFTIGDRSPRAQSFDQSGNNDFPVMVYELEREPEPPPAAPAIVFHPTEAPATAKPPVEPKPIEEPNPLEAKPAAARAEDRDRLQGRWTVMSIREAGKPPIAYGISLATVQFRDDQIEVRSKDEGDAQAERGTFRIEPGASPPAFRIEGMGKSAWMLYELEGDKLKLAFSQGDDPPRPKSFDVPGPDPKHPVAIWELVRATDAPAAKANKAALPGGSGPPAPPPADARADRERLQGRWVIVSANEAGLEGKGVEQLLLSKMTFHGNEIQWAQRNGEKPGPYTFVIDPDGDPKAMLVAPVESKTEAPLWWLYSFERNRLRIGMPTQGETHRPKGFDDRERPVAVFEMIRDDEPKPSSPARPGPAPLQPPNDPVEPEAVPAAATEPPIAVEVPIAIETPYVGQRRAVLEVLEPIDTPQPAGHMAAAEPILAPEADSRRLQGTWSILAIEEDGREAEPEADSTVLFAGNALVIVRGTGRGQMTIESGNFGLDGREQRWISLTQHPGAMNGTQLGIYRIDGASLLLCLARTGAARPTEFDTQPGSGQRLFVLRRKKSPRPAAEPASGMSGMSDPGAAPGNPQMMMRNMMMPGMGRTPSQPGSAPGQPGTMPGTMPGLPGGPPGLPPNQSGLLPGVPGSQPGGNSEAPGPRS